MSKRGLAIEDCSAEEETLELDTSHTVKLSRCDAEHNHEDRIITCSLPPRCNVKPRQFTVSEYEKHYQKQHVNICYECDAELPTEYFLDLHLEEAHSPIFQARLSRDEKVYRCFSQFCSELFASITSRRRHLEKVHSYPSEYRFNLVQKGLDGRAQSLLYQPPPGRIAAQQGDAPRPDASLNRNKVGVMTRAQRRAQARSEAETPEQYENEKSAMEIVPIELGSQSPSALSMTRKQAETRVRVKNAKAVNPKAQHAKAIEDLFKSLEVSQDATKDEEFMSDDGNDYVAVPTSIKFGHKR